MLSPACLLTLVVFGEKENFHGVLIFVFRAENIQEYSLWPLPYSSIFTPFLYHLSVLIYFFFPSSTLLCLSFPLPSSPSPTPPPSSHSTPSPEDDSGGVQRWWSVVEVRVGKDKHSSSLFSTSDLCLDIFALSWAILFHYVVHLWEKNPFNWTCEPIFKIVNWNVSWVTEKNQETWWLSYKK